MACTAGASLSRRPPLPRRDTDPGHERLPNPRLDAGYPRRLRRHHQSDILAPAMTLAEAGLPSAFCRLPQHWPRQDECCPGSWPVLGPVRARRRLAARARSQSPRAPRAGPAPAHVLGAILVDLFQRRGARCSAPRAADEPSVWTQQSAYCSAFERRRLTWADAKAAPSRR
jgi:hypothetical protein